MHLHRKASRQQSGWLPVSVKKSPHSLQWRVQELNNIAMSSEEASGADAVRHVMKAGIGLGQTASTWVWVRIPYQRCNIDTGTFFVEFLSL